MTGERKSGEAEARQLEAYFDRLWPLLRSLTGEGVRATHDILGELLPLTRFEVPSGTKVLDWTVPREWRVREAYIVGPDGRRRLDVRSNNLHLLNYSVPFRGRLSRQDLDAHLYSLPELPEAVPYITSYYQDRWGFCLSHRERLALPEGDYEVVIDSELVEGSMTISEAVLPGEAAEEILLSCYTCHPSLANNELSGPLVLSHLYRRLAARPRRRYTYRFVLVPETIGSIAYLSLKGSHLLHRMAAGYIINCVGTEGAFHLKQTRRGDSPADRAAAAVLGEDAADRLEVIPFRPDRGSDERQYNSPGFNLPVASLMRCPPSSYPEYHSSLDNKDFVSFPAMVETIGIYEKICGALEANLVYRNLKPFGEPQLGRRGLYSTLGDRSRPIDRSALLWVLNLADGTKDLLSIAEQSGLPWSEIARAAERLQEAELIAACDPQDARPGEPLFGDFQTVKLEAYEVAPPAGPRRAKARNRR